MTNNKGFTIVELLISVVVGLVVVAAIYGVMTAGQMSAGGVGRRVQIQQDARAVLDFMAMEIRMASYNPSSNPIVWGQDPKTSTGTCTGMTFVTARKGIQTATANEILIAMDLDGDGSIGYPDENEYIKYKVETSDYSISRSVTCGNADRILGGSGTDVKVVNTSAFPLFQYFDSAGTEITSPSDGNIMNIRRIRINIAVDVKNQTDAYKVTTKTYTTDVLVRNHVLSP